MTQERFAVALVWIASLGQTSAKTLAAATWATDEGSVSRQQMGSASFATSSLIELASTSSESQEKVVMEDGAAKARNAKRMLRRELGEDMAEQAQMDAKAARAEGEVAGKVSGKQAAMSGHPIADVVKEAADAAGHAAGDALKGSDTSAQTIMQTAGVVAGEAAADAAQATGAKASNVTADAAKQAGAPARKAAATGKLAYAAVQATKQANAEVRQLAKEARGSKTTTACNDDPDKLGLNLPNGLPAKCEHVREFCNHPDQGQKISTACPKTCGKCDIELIVENTTDCLDISAEEEPVFYHDGLIADCRLLQDLCPVDEQVQEKCKLTCQNCNGQIELLGPMFTGLANETLPEAAGDTSTTLYPDLSDNVNQIRDALTSGCARRRRFGLCDPVDLQKHMQQRPNSVRGKHDNDPY